MVTNDVLVATYYNNQTAYLIAYVNSTNGTSLGSLLMMGLNSFPALDSEGRILWLVQSTGLIQVSSCGHGVCNEGACVCNTGWEGENCDTCTGTPLFHLSGVDCKIHSLTGLGIFVIIVLPMAGFAAIVGLIFAVHKLRHRHHKKYQPIK